MACQLTIATQSDQTMMASRSTAESETEELDMSTVDLFLHFTAPGVVAGIALYGLSLLAESSAFLVPTIFAVIALLIGPPVYWLILVPGKATPSARFAAFLGAGSGALVIWSFSRFAGAATGVQAYPWSAATLFVLVIAFLSVPFRQAWTFGTQDTTHALYPRLFVQALNQVAAGLLAIAFALGAVLLVFTMVMLFTVIGIDLNDAILRAAVLLPIATAAFASAIGIVRQRSAILHATRILLLALLRILLPFQLIATAAFFVALVVLGLDSIEMDFSVTAILLITATLSLSLCSATVGEASRLASRQSARLACRALALLVLPLALLAAWTLWIRIESYGWTHDRVVGALLVAIALVYGAGYAAAALSGGRFSHRVQTSNITAATVTIVLAVLYFTPLLDGHRIGAASQLARLSAPETEPTVADLGYLKFSSGRAGRQALEALSNSPRASQAPLAGALAELALAESEVDLSPKSSASLPPA